MASAVALTFSKVVDSKNPLYLDDNCCENVDWDFGVLSPKEIKAPLQTVESKTKPKARENKRNAGEKAKAIKHEIPDVRVKIVEINSVDHDQMSDTATDGQFEEEECDEENMDMDAYSDSSLEPYDLTDDDTDLQKKISHLSDLAAALRKSDDPDGVSSQFTTINYFQRKYYKALILLSFLYPRLIMLLVLRKCL